MGSFLGPKDWTWLLLIRWRKSQASNVQRAQQAPVPPEGSNPQKDSHLSSLTGSVSVKAHWSPPAKRSSAGSPVLLDSEVNSGDPWAQPLQTLLTEPEDWQTFPHSSATRVRGIMGQTLQGKEGHAEYQDPKSGPLSLSVPLPPNHPQPKEQSL